MTLLHINGMEAAKRGCATTGSGYGAVTYQNSGRTGKYAKLLQGGQRLDFATGGIQEVVFGYAIRYGRTGDGVGFQAHSSNGTEITVSPLTNDSTLLVIRRGAGGTVLDTADSPISLNTWYYIEVHLRLSDTDGFCRVKLDGNLIMEFVGDTKNSSVSTPASIIMIRMETGGNGSSMEFDIDDVYMCDGVDATATQGRPFNTFLGPVRVEPRYPSGNGVSSDWVGSDGNSVDNYMLVDESPPSMVDYVQTSTPGARDLYVYPPLAMPTGQVLAVDVAPFMMTPDGGTAPIKSVIRDSGGTVAVGPGINPGMTAAMTGDKLHTKAPDGTLWTVAKANGAQYGVEAG